MTEIVVQAILIIGVLMFLLLILAYSSSKINGKKKIKNESAQILSRRTNIREIYNQNVSRTLKNEEEIKKNELKVVEKSAGTRLVVETYNKKLEAEQKKSSTKFEYRHGFPNAYKTSYDSVRNFYSNSNSEFK